MIVTWRGRDFARGLAHLAISPNAAGRQRVGTVRVIGGSIWTLGGWRNELSRLIAGGAPITAIGLRHTEADRLLTDGDWVHISRRLIRHSGLSTSPWLAIRRGPRHVAILAAGHRPPPIAALREFTAMIRRDFGLAQTHSGRQQQHPILTATGAPASGAPMRILDARHDTTHLSERLTVLVDRIPTVADLRFTPYPVDTAYPDQHHPGTLYVAVHPGGYLLHILDTGDGRGLSDRHIQLHLTDGTSRRLVGPWISNPETVAQYAPGVDVYHGEVRLHTDPDQFRTPTATGGGPGTLTRTAAEQARALADHRRRTTFTSLAARAFIPLREIRLTPPPAPQPRTDQPPPTSPPRPHR